MEKQNLQLKFIVFPCMAIFVSILITGPMMFAARDAQQGKKADIRPVKGRAIINAVNLIVENTEPIVFFFVGIICFVFSVSWLVLGIRTYRRRIATLTEKQKETKETEKNRCPKCGFSHQWDGTKCGHCNYTVEANLPRD